MPDTGKANGAAGGKFIDSVDPDDPEYQRQMMRPAEIKEDLTLMEQRKRVSLILNSEAFKQELEEIIQNQLKSGSKPASLAALQQISDLLVPHGQAALPVNDIRAADSVGYEKGERLLRCCLASACRLVDAHGWADGIGCHATCRIGAENFLTTPLGLRHCEVTASGLVKVNAAGDTLLTGSSVFEPDTAGWQLHSACLAGKPEARAVLQLQTPGVLAVSSGSRGLLPLSIEACIIGDVSACELTGMQEADASALASAAAASPIVLVHNRCALAIGATIEEAWFYASVFMRAVDTQLACLRCCGSVENLVLPSEEAVAAAKEVGNRVSGGVNFKSGSGHKWRRGELEFEAAVRQLDAAGCRTGYPYHEPNVRTQRTLRRHEDVEIPPSSSSFTYVFDGDVEGSKLVTTKQVLASRGPHGEWLSTPNTYHREEIEEINTDNPKKITVWKLDDEKRSMPIKISNPNQFAPQGADPKELRNQQRKVKDNYYNDTNTAGPQSRVLKDQLTSNEVQKLMDEGRAKAAADGSIVVGAASKGIIARQHQHNALVYHNYYSPNPFSDVSDDELQKYETEIRRKREGGTDASESETEQQQQQQQQEPAAPQANDTLPSIPEDSAAAPTPKQPEPQPQAAQTAPAKAKSLQRHESDRLAEKQRQQALEATKRSATVDRAQSQRATREKPAAVASTSRADTMKSDTSGAEEHETGEKKKKKKSGFRMPSFSSKDKKKKKEKEKEK